MPTILALPKTVNGEVGFDVFIPILSMYAVFQWADGVPRLRLPSAGEKFDPVNLICV